MEECVSEKAPPTCNGICGAARNFELLQHIINMHRPKCSLCSSHQMVECDSEEEECECDPEGACTWYKVEDNRMQAYKNWLEDRQRMTEKIMCHTGKNRCEVLINQNVTVDERDKGMVKRILAHAEAMAPEVRQKPKTLRRPSLINCCCVRSHEVRSTEPRLERHIEISGLPGLVRRELIGDDCCKTTRSQWLNSRTLASKIVRNRKKLQRVVDFFPDIENLIVVGHAITQTGVNDSGVNEKSTCKVDEGSNLRIRVVCKGKPEIRTKDVDANIKCVCRKNYENHRGEEDDNGNCLCENMKILVYSKEKPIITVENEKAIKKSPKVKKAKAKKQIPTSEMEGSDTTKKAEKVSKKSKAIKTRSSSNQKGKEISQKKTLTGKGGKFKGKEKEDEKNRDCKCMKAEENENDDKCTLSRPRTRCKRDPITFTDIIECICKKAKEMRDNNKQNDKEKKKNENNGDEKEVENEEPIEESCMAVERDMENSKEPTDIVAEPTDVIQEPTDNKEEPADSFREPTDICEEPTDSCEEPTDSGEEPADISEESTDYCEKLTDICAKRTDTKKETTCICAGPTSIVTETTETCEYLPDNVCSGLAVVELPYMCSCCNEAAINETGILVSLTQHYEECSCHMCQESFVAISCQESDMCNCCQCSFHCSLPGNDCYEDDDNDYEPDDDDKKSLNLC